MEISQRTKVRKKNSDKRPYQRGFSHAEVLLNFEESLIALPKNRTKILYNLSNVHRSKVSGKQRMVILLRAQIAAGIKFTGFPHE